MITIESDFIIFSQRPSPDVVKSFERHIEVTGRPETFSGTFKGRIDKNELFEIVKEFTIAQSKRGDDTRADCPMCRSNQYLTGWLVWFPQKQFVAAIGHCCANKENRAKAKRELEHKEQVEFEENYLMAHIPLVPQYISAIESLLPAAKEAALLYKEFRRADNDVRDILLRFKKREGRLWVEEEIISDVLMENSEITGRSRQHQNRTRTVEFGKLRGQVILASNFNPADELAVLLDKIKKLDKGTDRFTALCYVAELSDDEKHQQYRFLSKATEKFGNIKKAINDFNQFFSEENLLLIRAWGQHLANATPISVIFQKNSDGRVTHCSFVNKNSTGQSISCKLEINAALWSFDYHWPLAKL